MRSVHHGNMFRWTLRGKHYLILGGSSLAHLMLMMGVM